jgi:hypothetical protein
MATLEETGEPGIMLLKRPYNIYDAGANLGIANKLREYYNANVIPFDLIDLTPADLARYERAALSGARILAAAPSPRAPGPPPSTYQLKRSDSYGTITKRHDPSSPSSSTVTTTTTVS